MKTFLAILFAYVLTAWTDVHAATMVGQCVYPNLEPFKISVYQQSNTQDLADGVIHYDSYTVGLQNGSRIALWTVPDYRQSNPYERAGTFVGWVDKAQFDIQERRNCS